MAISPEDLGLTALGKQTRGPGSVLETIPWEPFEDDLGVLHPLAPLVTLDCTEFTSHCPVTGQPDFGTLAISYAPLRHLVETKSLKLYLWSYRSAPAFNEVLVRKITWDFYLMVKPRWVTVQGVFHQRGGIGVTARFSLGDEP